MDLESASQEYRDLVRRIEGVCDFLCESCGSLGDTSRNGSGWIKNTCPDCKEKIDGKNIVS